MSAFTHYAFVEFKKIADGQLGTPSSAPTITCFDGLTGDVISSPSITAVTTGIYRVEVSTALRYPIFLAVTTDSDYGDANALGEDMANEVWTTTTRTLSSFGTLIADIWAYTTRTLTQSVASIISAVSGDKITDIRGNDWSIDIDLDEDITGKEISFAVKHRLSDADSAALLFIDKDGLKYLNGETATASLGSIVRVDEATGAIRIILDASQSAELYIGSFKYGVQKKTTAGGAIDENKQGTFVVTGDVIRATS